MLYILYVLQSTGIPVMKHKNNKNKKESFILSSSIPNVYHVI